MVDRRFSYKLEQYNLKLILYFGLLMSETQFLYNVSLYVPVYAAPYFTLIYFVASTFYLLYLMISYGLFFQKSNNISLELYEHIILPISVLIITLLNRNSGFVAFKIVAILLLIVQSLLIVVKIIYFNSVTEQLAQISTITKVIRLIKICLIAVLPIFITFKLAVVIIISLCQLLSFSIYFFKFTYQHCFYQYLVLIGMFCGVVSAVEDIFQTIFGFPYLFIGQIASLYFYWNENNYLASVLQLKYTNSLNHSVQIKHDDDYLAGFLFVEECLLAHKKTMNISNLSKNEGTVQAGLLIDKLKAHHSAKEQHSVSERQLLIQTNVEGSQREIAVSLFEVIEERFINTLSFSCFQFLISNGLELGGRYISRALVIYYKHVEKRGNKNTILDRSKYELLYQRILKCLPTNENDSNQIKFIQFSQSLKELNNQIENCINNEIKLIEYLTDDDKKVELFPDSRLLDRHQLKSKIRKIINRCVGKSMYTYSSEFKFLYILYHMCIEKKLEGTKNSIKKLFLSAEVEHILGNHDENNLVVLSGFNSGEIVNSNEIFKSHFGITLNSFSRNNISEFIPSEKQRQKHSSLMVESYEYKEPKTKTHAEYECLLMVEKEFNNIKLKVIENYTILTRVYYENQESFNYVCCLNLKNPNAQENMVTLIKKDCDSFESKGFQLMVSNQQQLEQLDEQMEICDIEFNYEGFNSMSLQDKLLNFKQNEQEFKVKSRVMKGYLQEKLTIIEKRFLQEMIIKKKGFSRKSIFQLSIILVMMALMNAIFLTTNSSVNNFNYVLMNVKTPIRNLELVSNKILLEQLIITLAIQTPLFPDTLCQSNGINNLSSYTMKEMMTDLQDNTDQFSVINTLQKDYGSLVNNLFAQQYTAVPYLMNYNALITYNKYIEMMKSSVYEWINTNYELGNQFHSNPSLFTSILLNSTIDNQNSLYNTLTINQNNFIGQLTSTIKMLKIVVSILLFIFICSIIFLRMKDNCELINYLKIIEFINPEMLMRRMREMKYSLNQLHRLKSNRIESVEIDNDFIISIKGDKKEVQYIPLTEFTNWQINHKSDFQIQGSQESISKENSNLINDSEQSRRLPQSVALRALIYNWRYLLLMGGIFVALIATNLSLLEQYNTKTNTLINCDRASEELSRIQQKYINLVAYNWIKTLYIKYNISTSLSSEIMLQDAISSLMASDYVAKISNAYSKDISDQVLYGDVCLYFNNPTTCALYNNDIFKSGFSMLLPFSIKQEIQINNISNSYTSYIDHLCDSNWLLFEGVIPMTNTIGVQSMNLMESKLESGFLATTIEISFLAVLMVLLTLICQYQRYSKELIIREEVLSLDTVSNLYTINEFKPYFNKIYYS